MTWRRGKTDVVVAFRVPWIGGTGSVGVGGPGRALSGEGGGVGVQLGIRSEIFVAGTSCVGKSTCAEALGRRFGWAVVSTDRLGRHPGRPWAGAPEPVLEFYRGLSAETVHWFLQVHHENMRPVIAATIAEARRRAGTVFEGAALRPEHLDGWGVEPGAAVCLFADAEALRRRIREASAYGTQPVGMREAIDAFTRRSVRENEAFAAASRARGLRLIDTTDAHPGAVVEQVLDHVTRGPVGDRP